jgi:hypothetical protein
VAQAKEAMNEQPRISFLPAELNTAIGAFVTTWSNASAVMTMLMSNFAAGKTLGPTDDMVLVFAHIGMEVRVQLGLIRTMGRARMGEDAGDALDKICERLEKLKALRDKLAHAPWRIENGKAIAHTLKTVGKVKFQDEVVTAESVNAEVSKLFSTLGELIDLVQSHGFLLDFDRRPEL